MFNITVIEFCDLSNLSGPVILLKRITRGYWTRWGSIEVYRQRFGVNLTNFT